MKKLLFALLLTLPISAFAETTESFDWTLNIRRIGIDWSKTKVENADAYADSPISSLKAADQDFFKGTFDTVLEYDINRISWNNGLYMEYGRTALKPHNAPKTVNENIDKILLTTQFDYEVWNFSNFKLGPTVRGVYDTEFTATNGVPRRNQARIGTGIAMFDHPILKDLYVIGLYEYDFTYSNDKISKTGAEFGWRAEYEIRKGVKATTNGYYRDYFTWSNYAGTDLEWDLSAIIRLDTNLWGDFTVGPYVQYRRAKSREAQVTASNMMIGVSFNYITKFGL